LAPDPSKTKNYFKLLSIEFIFAAVIFIFSVLIFTALANEVIIENEDQFDILIYQFMADHISPAYTITANVITFLGSAYFIVPAYLLIIYILIRKKYLRYSIWVTVIAMVSLLSGLGFKQIFHRTRPVLPLIAGADGYSFPSGHSLNGFTFFGLLAYLAWKSSLRRELKWLVFLLLLLIGFMIGFSRIYLRVHYASDVLGSLLLTTTWLSLSFISMRIMENKITI
jgi:undecaprenyl-diphosphatase